ncbi:MAG: hypothetical protein KIT79_15680 [Deltaproteobacteria bacterium]|nr:hypothetical protein [Deltaproteobacteria bacterium]
MKALLEQMAEALIARDALRLRELALEWARLGDLPASFAPPESTDRRVRIAAAALAELLAERSRVASPEWTKREGSLGTPFFALAAAERLKSVRALCERESPEALRRHGIFAPANFLQLI